MPFGAAIVKPESDGLPGSPGTDSAAHRWRRGLATVLSLPLFPLRRLLRFDLTGLQSDGRRERGATLVLPGIEGVSHFNFYLAQGLADASPFSVELFDWTSRRPLSSLYNLCAWRRNRQQAEQLADLVQRRRREHPGRPIHLVGHSGGAAIAVFALEALAERNETVEQTLLLAAALSPGYDLTAASRAASVIHNFYSPLDIPHLVLGTAACGTIDRKFGVGAGARGFDRHALPANVFQHRYRLSMLRSWHWGGHLGWTNRVFARDYLAPLINPAPAPVA